jgi:hypothetical protein
MMLKEEEPAEPGQDKSKIKSAIRKASQILATLSMGKYQTKLYH